MNFGVNFGVGSVQGGSVPMSCRASCCALGAGRGGIDLLHTAASVGAAVCGSWMLVHGMTTDFGWVVAGGCWPQAYGDCLWSVMGKGLVPNDGFIQVCAGGRGWDDGFIHVCCRERAGRGVRPTLM